MFPLKDILEHALRFVLVIAENLTIMVSKIPNCLFRFIVECTLEMMAEFFTISTVQALGFSTLGIFPLVITLIAHACDPGDEKIS